MSFDFVKCVDRWSRGIRRRFITGEEFAHEFFREVGECAPSEEELLSVFETLPEETMAELLRMLNICDKAEYMPLAGIGGAKAKQPKIKWSCELLKPKIEARLGIERSDSD